MLRCNELHLILLWIVSIVPALSLDLSHARAVQDPPGLLDDAQDTAEAHGTKADAAALRARAGASRTKTSLLRVQQVGMQEDARRAELESDYARTNFNVDKAVHFSNGAVTAEKATKQLTDAAPAKAAQLAVVEVNKMLAGKYNELDEWRRKVLSDPAAVAAAKAKEAAKPYYDMANTFYSRMYDYRIKSAGTSANGEPDIPSVIAPADPSNPEQVSNDLMGLTSAQAGGAEFSEDSSVLGAASEVMRNVIPQYHAAAHQAAISAEFTHNYDGLPPAGLDPNYAYTPPPPVGGAAPA